MGTGNIARNFILLGLLFAVVTLISSEVSAAKDLAAKTTKDKTAKKNGLQDAKYEGNGGYSGNGGYQGGGEYGSPGNGGYQGGSTYGSPYNRGGYRNRGGRGGGGRRGGYRCRHGC